MKIPKRLPKRLQELVEMEHAFRNLTMVSAEMKRMKGYVHIELTYLDRLGDMFVTLDSAMGYHKHKREVWESASSQTRRADIYRNAVLAS